MKEAKFRIVFDKENEKITVFLNIDGSPTWMLPMYATKEFLSDESVLELSIPDLVEDALKSFRDNSENKSKHFKPPKMD